MQYEVIMLYLKNGNFKDSILFYFYVSTNYCLCFNS